MIETEFDFVLPIGYQDEQGRVHREGRIRLATALDEIAALRDPRVRNNEAYLVITLLSQVITQLGDLRNLKPGQIEQFFAKDIAFLQQLYRQINDIDAHIMVVTCPHCGNEHEVEIPFLGE